MSQRKKPDWFLPEWREYRGLSQEGLADLSGFGSKGYISDLESGKRRYNSDQLELFAAALGCRAKDIVMVNPLAEARPAPPDPPPDVTPLDFDRARKPANASATKQHKGFVTRKK